MKTSQQKYSLSHIKVKRFLKKLEPTLNSVSLKKPSPQQVLQGMITLSLTKDSCTSLFFNLGYTHNGGECLLSKTD